VDTIGKALRAIFTVIVAANLLAWQHGVLGFDGDSIRMINAMDILVGLLAGDSVYRVFRATLERVVFPILDAVLRNRNDRGGCECGKRHIAV